jgi:hypothetical protein
MSTKGVKKELFRFANYQYISKLQRRPENIIKRESMLAWLKESIDLILYFFHTKIS